MPTAPYTLEQAESDIAELRAQLDGMGEVHTLDGNGAVVPNPVPGAAQLFAATDGQPSFVTPAGLVLGNMGARQAFFPNQTVTGTSLSTLATFTIPAGDASVGAVYDLEVWGNGQWGSTAQILNMSIVLGGTQLSGIQIGANFMAVSIIFRWRAVARVICVTTGVTGTWSSLIYGNISLFNGTLLSSGASTANPTNSFVSCESTGTTTKDTTVSEALQLQASWNSTTGAPTISSQVALSKRIT